MDYEELYDQILTLEKALKDKLAGAQAGYKNITRNSEKGELKNLSKDLGQMTAVIHDYENIIAGYTELIDAFDAKEYMESGDFARQLTQYCESMSVDIKGEFPNYEIFPYKVRIDSNTQELVIDRKKSQSLRPRYFVGSIKKSQEKLNKAAFNVGAFLSELAEAYDIALLLKDTGGKQRKTGSAGLAGNAVMAGRSGMASNAVMAGSSGLTGNAVMAGSAGLAGNAGASGSPDSMGNPGKPAKTVRREHEILLKDLYNILVPMQRFRREYDIQNYAFDLARLYNSDMSAAKDGRLFEFGPSRNSAKLIRILDKEGKEQFLGTIRFYN
jgi:hypothetical protein